MEKEVWKTKWKENWKRLFKAMGAIIVLLGIGLVSAARHLFRRIVEWCRKYKGMTITIGFALFMLLFVGQTLHFKMEEKKQDLAFDSLARYCDSIENCSTYESGYAAGIREMSGRKQNLRPVTYNEPKKTVRRDRTRQKEIITNDSTK